MFVVDVVVCCCPLHQTLRTDREREQADYEARLAKMEEEHSSELQEVEESNGKKLMTEYEKYQELQARSLKLQEVMSSYVIMM